MKSRLSLLLAAAILLGGCTTFKLTPSGEKVRVLDPGEVSTCREMGKTSVTVTWAVLGIPRDESVVSKELRAVARNRAGEMGGDTIVPLTVIEEGRQTFVVYKCVNPGG